MRRKTLFFVVLVALLTTLTLGVSFVTASNHTKTDIVKYSLSGRSYGFLTTYQKKNHDLRLVVVLKEAPPNKTYWINLFEYPAEPVSRYPGHAHKGIFETIGTFKTDSQGSGGTVTIWLAASRLRKVLKPGSYSGHIDIVGRDPGPAFPNYFTANAIPFKVPKS